MVSLRGSRFRNFKSLWRSVVCLVLSSFYDYSFNLFLAQDHDGLIEGEQTQLVITTLIVFKDAAHQAQSKRSMPRFIRKRDLQGYLQLYLKTSMSTNLDYQYLGGDCWVKKYWQFTRLDILPPWHLYSLGGNKNVVYVSQHMLGKVVIPLY